MVLVFVIWLVLWYLGGSFSEIKRLLVDSIGQPRFRPNLALSRRRVSTEVVEPFYLGGINWGTPQQAANCPSDNVRPANRADRMAENP